MGLQEPARPGETTLELPVVLQMRPGVRGWLWSTGLRAKETGFL